MRKAGPAVFTLPLRPDTSQQVLMDGITRDACYDGLSDSFKNEVSCVTGKINEVKLNFKLVEDICLGQKSITSVMVRW